MTIEGSHGSYEDTRGGKGIWDTCRVDPAIAHLAPHQLPHRVFGYGSLTFRTGFPYTRRRAAVLPHFCRRFWQSSIDHRGTRAFPGRTALLVHKADVRKVSHGCAALEDVRGYVYDVDEAEFAKILAELDIREKNGYTRTVSRVTFDDDSEDDVVVYVGSIDAMENPEFAHGTIEETAAVISKAEGASGRNIEYFRKLHAIREISDAYLDELGAKVTEMAQNDSTSAE